MSEDAFRPNRLALVPPGSAEIHAADMTATFAADLCLDSLPIPENLWLPIDCDGDGNTAIGGLVEQNSTGPLRLGFGGWRDLLLGCQYLDGHDRLITVGGRTMKNVAGYDLTKWMIGQRGIFGRIVTITTRLYLRPTAAYLAEFYPDVAFFHSLLLSDCRPQWAIVNSHSLYCGYLGDQPAIDYFDKQLRRFQPIRWRHHSFQADEQFRRLHWRIASEWKMRASLPPSRIIDFVNSAALAHWVADPAFGLVISAADAASMEPVRKAAAAFGAAATFEGPGTFHWSPPDDQRDVLERLKRSLDPDQRLAPLPWKASPHEFPTATTAG